MTDVAVAQEISMRHQKQTILSKAKDDNEAEIEELENKGLPLPQPGIRNKG